jgi:hypothetical protein
MKCRVALIDNEFSPRWLSVAMKTSGHDFAKPSQDGLCSFAGLVCLEREVSKVGGER